MHCSAPGMNSDAVYIGAPPLAGFRCGTAGKRRALHLSAGSVPRLRKPAAMLYGSEMALRKILYVEDDDDIRTVTLLALEMLGDFSVEPCASGAEALARAEAFGPDLILIDVMMPELDGPSTLARLRDVPGLADVPAVFFTANARPDQAQRLRSFGASAVLAKPF